MHQVFLHLDMQIRNMHNYMPQICEELAGCLHIISYLYNQYNEDPTLKLCKLAVH